MSDQFKRHIAYKFRIGDLLLGKPIFDGEKFIHLELGDKKISRVNIIGNIVERFDSKGEKHYTFFTLDDGSGQIKLRVFGEDVEKYKDINQGQTVLIIGVLRSFNNETYITPEVIKENEPKYLLVRKLEIEKNKIKPTEEIPKQEAFAIRDKILEKIKTCEEEGGIELDSLIMEFKEVSADFINKEVQKLLEEGIVFEPRPGKIRYLG
jgi:RPA family protein